MFGDCETRTATDDKEERGRRWQSQASLFLIQQEFYTREEEMPETNLEADGTPGDPPCTKS